MLAPLQADGHSSSQPTNIQKKTSVDVRLPGSCIIAIKGTSIGPVSIKGC